MPKETVNDLVSLLVRHRVKPGHDQHYEQWLKRTVSTASGYPGHLGVNVMRDLSEGLPLFTCLLRFASTEQLFAPWLQATVTHHHLEPGHGQ